MATPVLGALLRQVAGVDELALATLLVLGLNMLLALALGGVAFRLSGETIFFVATTMWSGWMLLWDPFVGYTDNVLALLMVVGALALLGEARRGPVAVAILIFVAFLAHPPVAAAFAFSVVFAAGFGILLTRSLRSSLTSEGRLVAAALTGIVGGYAAWRLGAWGPGQGLGDAIHPSGLTRAEFRARLYDWLAMLKPLVTIPLLALGVLWMTLSDRTALKKDLLRRTAIVWVLPILGAAGVFTSLSYPYHRFVNVSAGLILAAGIGLGALLKGVTGRGDRARSQPLRFGARAMIAICIATAILVPLWLAGVRAWRTDAGTWGYVRPTSVALHAYLDASGDTNSPIVFVASSKAKRPWSDRRGTSNRLRAGLPGDAIVRSYTYVGRVQDLLATRPTTDVPQIAEMSRGSLAELTKGVGDRRPLVMLIRSWNRRLGNAAFLESGRSVPIGGGVYVLKGRTLAPVDPQGVAAARLASAKARVAKPPGLSLLLRGAVGVLLIAFLPGALACRYFERCDFVSVVTIGPVVSLAISIMAGLVVLGISDHPLDTGTAWVITGLAVLAGAGLFFIGYRRNPEAESITTNVLMERS